jgi:integrase
MSRAGIDHWFRRCVDAAGLAGYTMHQLRHAAIDQIRRDTGDVEIARLLARHEDVAVTQGYLHSNEVEDLRAAIEKVVERGV